MQKTNGNILFSAGDIVNFLSCNHHTALDLTDLITPLPKTHSNEELQLIQAKGHVHESRYAEMLRQKYSGFIDISKSSKTNEGMVRKSLEAMQAGAEIIYQPILRINRLTGTADFLSRVPKPSVLGEYSYEVLDTKLSLSARTRFVIQLAFYSKILATIQGVEPTHMHVVLGDMTEKIYACKDYSRYLDRVLLRFFEQIESWQNKKANETYPDPQDYCEMCRWLDLCEKKRIEDDHLSQVAGIRKTQIPKLQASGIHTMEALGRLDRETRIPDMAQQTLKNLQQQARLQWLGRETGENQLEILATEDGQIRGFARLPRPDHGDMFFDMEGNPFEEGGLEYLFGLYFFDGGVALFKDFWAHDRNAEKTAFEDFMDFVTDRLKNYPDAHIYHYAHYEETALKRLMSLHGTREAEVDNLLRTGKLIDLYKVVREGLRVSEPSYSIKNMEHFYMEKRSGDVQSAGASIVFYEKWKETGDQNFLAQIRDYNFDDVRSTYELREWLLSLRPEGLCWAKEKDGKSSEQEKETKPDDSAVTAHENRIEEYRKYLIDSLPEDRSLWQAQDHLMELTWQLLDFHRREDKPQWWAMFSRMEMENEDLIDDIECIGGLVRDQNHPPRLERQSFRYTYMFPEQETKLKTGDKAVLIDTGKMLSNLTVDDSAGRVSFTISKKNEPPPEQLNIGPGGPIDNNALREAVFRFANHLIAGDHRYHAIETMLKHELPRIIGHEIGRPIIDESKPALLQIIDVVAKLDRSFLFVQGPPGSGKTYTGSHVIVSLLKQGFRVGVSSNSHKAITNLLNAVEDVALEQDFFFTGVKKSTRGNDGSLMNGRIILDVFENGAATSIKNQLIAGTAWLFSRPEMDQSLDYLFVDEAGQVSLANLVAMCSSSKSIVLLGDQMQLGQPIQGIHPGRSGESSLEYLLNGRATIPPEQGVFLKTTWRMHPNVCALISEMIYDGRLEPEAKNKNQELILEESAHPDLLQSGVRFISAIHNACSQKSEKEAEIIRDLVDSLVCQRYKDKNAKTHPLGLANILVVAPYNMQVNLLKRMLPENARVGTVDKFQGQQAEVVIVSMTTSDETYLPRFIGFLYSKNRLNVALSRARSLAILVANPALMSINCSRPEEVALVNALCWVKDYSDK